MLHTNAQTDYQSKETVKHPSADGAISIVRSKNDSRKNYYKLNNFAFYNSGGETIENGLESDVSPNVS